MEDDITTGSIFRLSSISIHVLRVEDDDVAAVVRSVGGISIHVLRVEDDIVIILGCR